MSNILNPDNGFFTTINKIVDIIWISVIWSVFCFPIFTLVTYIGVIMSDAPADGIGFFLICEMLLKSWLIGPATTAMYYTMVKVVRRERGYATAQFFKCFKANFKSGVPVSIAFVLFAIVMYIDILYAAELTKAGSQFGGILTVAFLSISIFAVFVLLWIFPMLSRFQMRFLQLFKNALLISVRHFLSTLVMAAFLGICIYVVVCFVPAVYSIFFPLVFPGVSMLVRSFVIEPVFKRYMGESTGDPETTGVDEWYRE